MQKACTQCGQSFEITIDDLDFYDKISPTFNGKKELIPPPTHCPECRLQRRTAWRNDFVLYKRASSLSGKPIVSVHPADAPFPVYENREWWSEAWNPLEYGRDIDFSRSFVDQWIELLQVVPQISLMNDNNISSENCEYCQDFAFGRNCYLATGCWHIEDAYYADCSDHCKNIADCFFTIESELCYECANVRNLYNCAFLQDSEQCTDCFFGFDLKGCESCVGCIGLRQKKFHIFNQPYLPEEYKERVHALHLDSYRGLEAFRAQYDEWLLRYPRRNMLLLNCEDSKGDYLSHCKSTFAYNVYNGEHSRYSDKVDTPQWSYDVYLTGRTQYCYDCMTPDDSYGCMATISCWKCKFVLYSTDCHNCEHCFGCNGLKRAKYCILNKQYKKEEYEELVPAIITRMREDKEWGEFFPMRRSPFGYNESIAQEYFPLSKEEVTSRGWKWREREELSASTPKIAAIDLPDSIEEVTDEIAGQEIGCVQTGRPFRIVKSELELYRRMHLPLPRLHPDERRSRRVASLRSRKLWQRTCAHCHQEMDTTYAPERPEVVYCEECYLATVY